MIERDDGIEEHEERLRDAEDILQRASRLGLEVSDAVITHVTNCASSQWWQGQSGDRRAAELGELLLQDGEGITLGAMTGTSLDYFPGTYLGTASRQPWALSFCINAITHVPAPTKLYLPIVSVVAALS